MATEFPVSANTKQAVKDVGALERALRKTGKEAGLTEKQIDEIVASTKKVKTDGGKHLNEFNKGLGGVNKTIKSGIKLLAAYFSVQKARQFIGEVVKITAEFQKLEAVLTNTLGSKSQAQQVFAQIKKFASETPFSVLELTQSFVKLANQGIKPNQEQLRKLGDLAASTGKQYDQLTEAIIDAQTGEFERLKEFGIRASKQGDQVVFTFKGVQTQVEFTNEAIVDYIFALGDAEGVSGSMEAISKTLGGQISNLGDTWDDLLNTIGDGNNRVLSGTVALFADIVAGVKSIIITEEQLEAARTQRNRLQGVENFQAFAKAYDDMDKALVVFLADNEKEIDLLREKNEENAKKEEFDQKQADIIFDRIERLKDENKAVQEYVDIIKKEQELKKQKDADAAKLARLKAEKEAYEKLTKARKKFLESFLKQGIEDGELGSVGGSPFSKFLTGDLAKGLGADSEQTEQELKDQYDREFELLVAATERSLEYEIEANQRRKEAVGNFRDYSIDAVNEIFRTRLINTQLEMAMLEAQYQQELKAAGDNKAAKEEISKQFNEQQTKLLIQQAKQQQQAAIFNIAVNEGPAIAKTASTLGFPLAIPFIAAIGVLFALQLANTRKLAGPDFKIREAAEGDFDIQGPGTETSDSIPYMLSVHETVNPARNTKRFPWLLGPMVKNKDFNERDLRSLVDQHLPNEYNPIFFNQAAGADSPEMLNELRATRKAIENKVETRLIYDEEGFSVWRGKDNDWVKKVNRRYST